MDKTGFIDTGAEEIGIEEIDTTGGLISGYGDGLTGMGDG